MEGLWGLAGRMGRRPNRPEGRFPRAEPAAAADRSRAGGGQGVDKERDPGWGNNIAFAGAGGV